MEMSTPLIIPVILSGGAGTRLWPLSRSATPKQFLGFGGQATLLQQTLERCQGDGFDARPILVGATDHRGQLIDTLLTAAISADVILEPCRRNSCAAVLAGALRAIERDPDAIVLVLAADHHIPDHAAFRAAARQALSAARAGDIVTFGIKPQHAATGYGYILPATAQGGDAVARVQRFVEKPDAITAQRYMTEGYLWNSGNFLFQAAAFVAEVREHAPDVLAAVSQSLADAARDPDFIRLSESAFAMAPSVSVDFAVMENTKRAAVLPVSYVWSDIGTWDAVAAVLEADADGNVIAGKGIVVDSRNVMVQSDAILTAVVGCEDVTVITTPQAVLVLKRGSSEKVKILADMLRQKGFNSLL
jgi:mannose-1-phosphate guanylyltransferase / mannose-6-phosphate isomerase